MMRMIDFDTLFTIPPYALKKIEKEQLHKQYLDTLCPLVPEEVIVFVISSFPVLRRSYFLKSRTGSGGFFPKTLTIC